METEDLTSHTKEYFAPKSEEEDYPLQITDANINQKYILLESLYNTFFPEDLLTIAKDSSKHERDIKQLTDSSFVYGEITFNSIAYIFEYIISTMNIIEGEFIDFGSGTGRGVLSAAFCYPFTKFKGIEYIEALYKLSLNVKSQYKKKFPDYLKEYNQYMPKYNEELPLMEFQNDDFLNSDISNVSFILCNSTCFSVELMQKLGKKFNNECKSGCIVITFTKMIPNLNKKWEIKRAFRRIMSWGIATVFIHKNN